MKTASASRCGSVALLVILVAAACSAGAAGGGPTAGVPSQPPDVVVTSPPDSGSGGGGGGGGIPPDAKPSFVVPQSGQLEPHAVSITRLAATVNGRTVTVQADWWSGVEPCYVLDSIQFVRTGDIFTVSLFEGHGPQMVACIEIAVLKATTFSLGQLEPGTYTIRATSGEAAPITITIS